MTGVASAYVPNVRRWRYQWHVPWFAAAAVLTIAVAGLVSAQVADLIALGGPGVTDPGSGPTPASGDQWRIAGQGGLIIAVEIGLLMAGYAVYRRLPEWFREKLRENAAAAIALLVFMLIGHVSTLPLVFVGVVWLFVGFMTYDVLQHYEVWWPVHNLFTIAFAGGIAGVLAQLGLGPVVALAVLLALLDPLAVKLSGYMLATARWGLASGIPIAVVLPEGWKVNIPAWATDECENEQDVKVLGNGDLLLPAGVAVAANAAGTVPVAPGVSLLGVAGIIGAVAGVTLTTGIHMRGTEPAPAMPAIIVGLVPPVAAGWLLETTLATLGVGA